MTFSWPAIPGIPGLIGHLYGTNSGASSFRLTTSIIAATLIYVSDDEGLVQDGNESCQVGEPQPLHQSRGWFAARP